MQINYEKPTTSENPLQKKLKTFWVLALLMVAIFLAKQKGVTLNRLASVDIADWIILLAPAMAILTLRILLNKSQWDIAGKYTKIPINSQETLRTFDVHSREKKSLPLIISLLSICTLTLFFFMNNGPIHPYSISMWKNILIQTSVILPGILFLLAMYIFSIFNDKHKSAEELIQEDLIIEEQSRKNADRIPFTGISIWQYILFLIIVAPLIGFGINNLHNQRYFVGGLFLFIATIILSAPGIYKKE